jgi:hypothetical protein
MTEQVRYKYRSFKSVGNHLKYMLERVLAPTGGEVLAVLLVPDFVNQLDLEGKI